MMHTPHSHLSQHSGLHHSSRSTHCSPLPRPAWHCPLSCLMSIPSLQPETTPGHPRLSQLSPAPGLTSNHTTCSLPHSLCSSHAGLVPLLPASQARSCLMALVQPEPLPGILFHPFSFRDQPKCPQHPAQGSQELELNKDLSGKGWTQCEDGEGAEAVGRPQDGEAPGPVAHPHLALYQ